jgi:hypothetical protein
MNSNYSEEELADLVFLGVIALMSFIGFGLCFASFQEAKLILPKLNLAGMVIAYFIPMIIGIGTVLGRHLSETGKWRHAQAAAEKFGFYPLPASGAAFYFSSGTGYISGVMVLIILLVWISLMVFAYRLNLFWRQKKPIDQVE